MPSYSIIVIFKEETLDLQHCLFSVSRAARFRDQDPDYELLTSDKPNKSLARNDLCQIAKGDILVFLDSDAEASDSWLHELLKPFQDPLVGVVGGCHLMKQTASKREEMADKILAFPLATWKSASRYKVAGKIREVDESELTSCNLAIRKDAFLKAGGFPLDFIPCEENVLMNRIQALGYKMVYNPLAIVFHNRDELFRPHMKKIFFYAEGRGRMIRHNQGGIKFFPRPSSEFLLFGAGLIAHYTAYVSGLIWGMIKG